MFTPGGGQQPPRQPEFDLEQLFGRIRGMFGGSGGRFGGGNLGILIIAVIALLIIIWAATGVYTVSPGENAALRLFGAVQGAPVAEEGLHWWWPSPVGNKDVVLVTETRRMELGFRSNEAAVNTPFLDEALMISGDLNIVDVQMVVQYRISNLNNFLFNVDDPGEQVRFVPEGRPDGRTLKDGAEAALRLVVGQRSIDDVLVRNREEVETDTRTRLQAIVDSYQAGIEVISVQLQDVKAPEEVRDAFDDVLRARQERETRINQAEAYAADVIPRARGDAQRIIEAAEAFKRARIETANGEARRFESVLNEYQSSPEVTRQRLYLEALENVFPGVTKIIVDPDTEPVLILGQDGNVIPAPIGPNP
ncbi:MAG: FtsH protease activity modulator HflK [Chloroflexota bacterium]|nr:FtsH protease activity modulator HflK [Chloroflexota bacterium]MDE2961400.1 FtsH protease activity modulator HflK [Chloroflexota bacterium]